MSDFDDALVVAGKYSSNWQQTTQFYEVLMKRPKYADFAKGMFDLVSILRKVVDFKDIHPRPALGTLTLGVKGKKTRIHIHWENASHYSIYLDHQQNEFYGEKTTVPFDEIIPAIKRYLLLIKE